MSSSIGSLRNRSIELFNSLLASLDKDKQELLFEYEAVLTEIQIFERNLSDDNLDDILLVNFDKVHNKKHT